jgi:hypothetical protein
MRKKAKQEENEVVSVTLAVKLCIALSHFFHAQENAEKKSTCFGIFEAVKEGSGRMIW